MLSIFVQIVVKLVKYLRVIGRKHKPSNYSNTIYKYYSFYFGLFCRLYIYIRKPSTDTSSTTLQKLPHSQQIPFTGWILRQFKFTH